MVLLIWYAFKGRKKKEGAVYIHFLTAPFSFYPLVGSMFGVNVRAVASCRVPYHQLRELLLSLDRNAS